VVANLVGEVDGDPRHPIRRVDDFGASARIAMALDDIAVALSSRPTRSAASDTETYADGYFSALCFVLGVLTDESPTQVADRALRRVRRSQ